MSLQLKPTSQIKLELGINPSGRVIGFMTNACYKRMDKYVPKDEGNLRKISHTTINKIIYDVPYAEYQYSHEFNPENYTTPGTGGHWDKKMLSAEKEQLVKEVQKYIDGGR